MDYLLPQSWPLMSVQEIASLAPIQPVLLPAFEGAGLNVYMKREDLLDPLLGGNKVYKLVGHIAAWSETGGDLPIASFGGAYSNHLLALAAAGKSLGVRTFGIVRGERPSVLSPTLLDAQSLGMHLHFVSRSTYRQKEEPTFREAFEKTFGQVFWVPEGGGGLRGLAGCMALGAAVAEQRPLDVVCHACGTGASLAGIACGLPRSAAVLGVAVLKGDLTPMTNQVAAWIKQTSSIHAKWKILANIEGLAYGKMSPKLAEFMVKFAQLTGISLDAVYTAKLMSTIVELAQQGYWKRGTTIVAIHSGGIQGNRGYPSLLTQQV